jgi:gas vesicle protein
MVSPGTDASDRPTGKGAGSATATAKTEAEHLTERVKDKGTDLKRQAADVAHDAGQRARSAADQQKNAAAGQIEDVAHAVRTAAADLRDRGQPMVAEYSRHLAEGLESMAQSLSGRDVDDLVEGVEEFARERPAVFLGGAVVAGFALARFMKSSAARRHRRDTGYHEHHGGYASASASLRPGAAASPAGAATAGTTSGSAASPGATPTSRGSSPAPGAATAGVKRESDDATH